MLVPITEHAQNKNDDENFRRGIFRDMDAGEYVVVTPTQHRIYKTFKGALKGAKRLGAVKSFLQNARTEDK